MKAGTTMESLATEIMRQKENKADYIVYVNGLYVEACGGDLILHVLDGNGTDRIEPLDTRLPWSAVRSPHIFQPAAEHRAFRFPTRRPESCLLCRSEATHSRQR